MIQMVTERPPDPDREWLDHVQPVGLVVSASLLEELGLTPVRQTAVDTGLLAELLEPDTNKPALSDPWKFVESVLGWEARHVEGAPGREVIPSELLVSLPKHGTVLSPSWAVMELGQTEELWQLLVRIEPAGTDPDARGVLDGWEATPHQRFERLLRDTGVFAGLLISDHALRLIYAPRGETSGHLTFPLRSLGTVAGRPMLGGLKLLLDRFRLFSDADDRRLPALLKRSRDAQASVSTALAEQVLGALHELLRGFDSAERALIRELAEARPDHVYEGLLTVLMRLVFVLYAEDRDLLPSRIDGRAREIYETGYSLRGLYAKLTEDAALNPDTMDERGGGWGRLLALFRLVHSGHRSGFMQARGGKLFDPDQFLFLEGRRRQQDSPRVTTLSDGCILRILEGLMTLQVRGGERQRVSYRALDVEQIGSVYETVMGFTVQLAAGQTLAIKAGKNNRTPVFVDLEDLVQRKGKNRIKHLKEVAGRGQLSSAQATDIEAALSVDDVASALDSIVDDRATPRRRILPAGTPILQPTGERRHTGSYYTPRSLTAPIVKYALHPAFERLGPDATAEQILDLKICDPAMGSGAFLVAACRVLGERLAQAWARWPGSRPVIPADEDEDLHARRLVAQRCLYGVDKNPRAVDLARLALWLATLARDHEFTFLDHALKAGDSLIGLTRAQIESLHWSVGDGLPLFDAIMRDKFAAVARGRREIREAGDDVPQSIQATRYRQVEVQLHNTRLIGTAIIGAFFAAKTPKAREKARQEIESWANGGSEGIWPRLEAQVARLEASDPPLLPLHWEIEFPEVFASVNPGFDAIVGNPPYLGGRKISGAFGQSYLAWLLRERGAHGNADLVAYFFQRAFALLRHGSCLGFIATNTISQGDTRAAGLEPILAHGGAISSAIRRFRWPGEAAVVTSIVHIDKGTERVPLLDHSPVSRISSYLVEGRMDVSPAPLAANAKKAFQGSIVLGMGFTFDDVAAAKGKSASIKQMHEVLEREPQAAACIYPYLGGDEVNNDPAQGHHRYVIDFGNLSMEEVAKSYPALLGIVETFAKPERLSSENKHVRAFPWWKHWRPRPRLASAMKGMREVLVTNCGASAHFAICQLPSGANYAHSLVVFVIRHRFQAFAVLQSRLHELWARSFSSSMKDDLRYTPSDCFRTFPFPQAFGTDRALETAGETYHGFRAQLMTQRNEGLTRIYNRFHARTERSSDITRLRELHAELDIAVLRAYRWDDLAGRASPEFIEQDADEGKTPKTRFDWPAQLKDVVLARLLALNAERAGSERAAGTGLLWEEDEDEDEFDEETTD
jgi:hypothetical protein